MSKEIEKDLLKTLRRNYILAKCQAEYRQQIWELDFDTFKNLWIENDRYKNRGRGRDNYHMRRIQIDNSWNPNNVEIVSRGKHLSDLMIEKNRYGRR